MLDADTIDRMVSEACTIERADDIFPAQCVRDICCHVKALASEVEQLTDAIHRIDQTLRVPAAEYVPAIGDVFTIIDKLGLTQANAPH